MMDQRIYDLYLFTLKDNCELEQKELGSNIYQIIAYSAGEPFIKTVLSPDDSADSQGFARGPEDEQKDDIPVSDASKQTSYNISHTSGWKHIELLARASFGRGKKG